MASDLYKKIEKDLKSMILEIFREEKVKIILFGSRAVGLAKERSDIDVALLPENGFDPSKLTLLREKIENSNIPYKVEIIDLSHASDAFKKRVLEEGVFWKS